MGSRGWGGSIELERLAMHIVTNFVYCNILSLKSFKCLQSSRVRLLNRLALGLLADEGLVNVRDDAAASDGGLDEGVQFLVTADGKLQVPGSDTLHLQVLGGVSGQLEYLGKDS